MPAPALLTGRENEPPIKGQVPRLLRGKIQFIFVRIWPTQRRRKGCSGRFDRVVSHLRGVNDYSRYDEHAVYDGECPEQSVKAVSHLWRRENPAGEKYKNWMLVIIWAQSDLPDGDGIANESKDGECGADDALRPQHAGGGHVGGEAHLHANHLQGEKSEIEISLSFMRWKSPTKQL